MPSPLPPLKPKLETGRLSFLHSPKINPNPNPGGVPTVTWIIQLYAEFDPVSGEGQWKFMQFPQSIDFYEYEEFERFCKEHLPIPRHFFNGVMDYLHNYYVLNIDLKSGEVYPVVPRPSGFDVPIPLAGAPGNYLGGGNQ